MRTPRPVYRVGDRRYRVDDCSIQVRAIEAGQVEFRGFSTGWYPGDPIDTQTLKGISSIGTLNTLGWQEWGTGPHRNEGIEICYLETGSTVLHVNRTAHEVKTDTVTVTRPWQLHRLGDPGIGRCRLHWFILDVGVRRPRQPWTWPDWVILSPADQAELTSLIQKRRSPVVHRTANSTHGFRQIADALEERGPSCFSRMAISVNTVLLGLLQAMRTESKEGGRPDTVSRQAKVQAFLHQLTGRPEWLAEPWTLDRMAACCDMRSTAFVQYCRRVTNQSPCEYLLAARIKQAETYLRQAPGRTITDIALACGFSSSQYFATQFKRHTSLTPRAWRKRNEETP